MSFPVCRLTVWPSSVTSTHGMTVHTNSVWHSLVFSPCWTSSSVATKSCRLGNRRMWVHSASVVLYTHTYICTIHMCVCIYKNKNSSYTKLCVSLLECFFLYCIVIVCRHDNWDQELSALDIVQKFTLCVEFTPGERKYSERSITPL